MARKIQNDLVLAHVELIVGHKSSWAERRWFGCIHDISCDGWPSSGTKFNSSNRRMQTLRCTVGCYCKQIVSVRHHSTVIAPDYIVNDLLSTLKLSASIQSKICYNSVAIPLARRPARVGVMLEMATCISMLLIYHIFWVQEKSNFREDFVVWVYLSFFSLSL